MKTKLLTLLLLIGVAFILFVVRTSSKIEEPVRYPVNNRLDWMAKKAKSEGKVKVELPGPIIDYAGVDIEMDEAIRDYSVVVAEPIFSKSYIVNGDDVLTWYKFRIIDTLSHRSYEYCHTCSSVSDAPSDMSSLNSDEFITSIAGGTVIVDGIEVTVENRDLPVFEIGGKYVLFISLAPSGIALPGGGPSGVFRIGEDGALEAMSKRNSPMQRQMKQRFNLNLENLKSRLRNSP